MSFQAHHPGICSLCRSRFPEGTTLVRIRDGYAHEVCPDPLSVDRQPCSSCFTVPTATGECLCS